METAMQTTTTMRGPAAVATRRVRVLMFGMMVAVLATWATSTWAQPGGHGMHHGGGGMMMGGSPEHMGRMIDHMLDGVDATEAQRSQIRQIVQGAAADLKTQREAARGLRQRGLEVFTQPNVDANAAESVRQQMLVQHDQMSRRTMQAMLEISRVLTPEQKAKIADRIKQRAARMQERMERMQKERQPR
jgi:periplasmic protein CpxP/Spy